MRKISRNFIGLTTAVALTVVACSDDPTGVTSGDELTAAEVAVVMAALGSAFESVGVAAQAPPAQAAISVDESFDESVPCESGNLEMSGSISGSINDETFDMDITMDVSLNPHGCVVGDDENTFTLDGAPEIKVVLDMTSSEGSLTVSGMEKGGFSFTSSDGRTGSCAFDVTFSVVTGESGNSSDITGKICGLEASNFETFGT